MTPTTHTKLLSPAQLQKIFTNSLGEKVHAKIELLNDDQRGDTWRQWSARYFPAELFRTFRLINATQSEEWLNVVEHCIFVAAASLTLARQMQVAGQTVDETIVVQAAMVHDVTKRVNAEQHKSRESEPYDTLLANELLLHGYNFETIAAALNTGRAADRFIADPRIRMQHIAGKGLEAAIVAYCDARTRGSRIYSLEDAKEANLLAKTRADDIKYFSHFWFSYYRAVEAYLRHLNHQFDPQGLNDESIYQTIIQDINHGKIRSGRPKSPETG